MGAISFSNNSIPKVKNLSKTTKTNVGTKTVETDDSESADVIF